MISFFALCLAASILFGGWRRQTLARDRKSEILSCCPPPRRRFSESLGMSRPRPCPQLSVRPPEGAATIQSHKQIHRAGAYGPSTQDRNRTPGASPTRRLNPTAAHSLSAPCPVPKTGQGDDAESPLAGTNSNPRFSLFLSRSLPPDDSVALE